MSQPFLVLDVLYYMHCIVTLVGYQLANPFLQIYISDCYQYQLLSINCYQLATLQIESIVIN